jgi:ABC-type uncharacterized transport system permease subunit
MLMGALAAEIVGYAVHAPTVLHIPLCVSRAFLGGAIWASLPAASSGLYRRQRACRVCLMMNPIALAAARASVGISDTDLIAVISIATMT